MSVTAEVPDTIEEPETAPEPEPTEEPTEEPEPVEEEAPEGHTVVVDVAARAPLTEKEIEKRVTACEKAATTWRNRFSSIFEEDANDFKPCPACLPWAPGFLQPIPFDDGQVSAIVAELTGTAEADYKRAEDANACPTCDGLGQVITGSRVPSHRTKMCGRCNGAGYVVIPGPAVAGAVPVEQYATAPTLTAVSEPPVDTDPWGRSRSDPMFGIMPGYER